MSRGLLDTHVLLWALADDRRLPTALRARIGSEPDRFVVSDVSLWEIAIKRSLGKVQVSDRLPDVVDEVGFGVLPITRRHAWAVRDLPLVHRDPFDRLLVAQARAERLSLVSADRRLAGYEVEVQW